MAAMGPATVRGSRKKPQFSAPTLSPPLSQQEFRGFFLRSEQVRAVWQVEPKNGFRSRPRICTKRGRRPRVCAFINILAASSAMHHLHLPL